MAATFPTNIPPDKITSSGIEYKTTIIKFESGAEQRFRNDAIGKESYKLQWVGMNMTDLNTLIAHFRDRNGSFRTFTWADARLDQIKTVRFSSDKLTIEKLSSYFANVTVEVTEC